MAVPAADDAGQETTDFELKLPYWFSHHHELLQAGLWATARRLPWLMGQAARLAWQANRRDAIVATACNVIAGLFTAFGLLATTSVLTALFAQGPTPARVQAALPALLLVGAATVIRAGLLAAAGWAQSRLSPQVERLIQRQLVEQTTAVELRAFDDSDFHDAMHRARDRGSYEGASVLTATIDMLTGAVGVASAATALGILHPLLLPLLLLAALPDGWAAVRSARMRYQTRIATSLTVRRKWILSDLMADIRAAAEVRSFTMRGFLLRQFDQVAGEEQRLHLDLARRQTLVRGIGDIVAGAGTLAVYLALGVLLATDLMPLAVAGTAVLAIRTAQTSMANLLFAVNTCYEAGLYFDDCIDFLNQARSRTPATGHLPAPHRFQQIQADHVTFTYPGADTPALRDVSITISHGKIIALVGENGSGKTTLAKILAGLYTPEGGEVRWDDTPLTEIDREDLWERIAVVAQDHTHWPLTVRHNIIMGRPLDTRALNDAARCSGADQVITDLPHGHDTLLDKRFAKGHELSGGQWQRISASRGFYRTAPLLICDEPTAALDARAEHAIFQSIREHADKDKTILLISHRLASVRNADYIYVLGHGSVIEQGSHHELMTRGGLYADLYNLQASQYHHAPTEQKATT